MLSTLHLAFCLGLQLSLVLTMQRSLFTETELRLATERQLKFQGTAKVNIDQIHFHSDLPKELDLKQLDVLRQDFQNNCLRLDIQNHVTAIISRQHLETA